MESSLIIGSRRTPGHELEAYLNKNYGPGNEYYEDFCTYIRRAVKEKEGWVATIEMDGSVNVLSCSLQPLTQASPKYRRSKVALPNEDTKYLSITTVWMDSQEEYSGQYHQHPYGEINCVIKFDETAELKGMQGWQGAGWTSPGPGTHHYPEVRGGALVALFFLPAGRISYTATPDMPQPQYL